MCIWTRCCWWAAWARSNRRRCKAWFAAGASTASVVWFSLLGVGARWLAPWFARPTAWRVLDGLIGVTMAVLAVAMARHAWGGI
jgi:L-lysine exporter family protein LysE/ArgO